MPLPNINHLLGESHIYQHFFDSFFMSPLELNSTIFRCSAASEFGLESLGEILDAYLFLIQPLDNCYNFTELSLYGVDSYSLLFASDLLANTKLLR